MTFSLFHRLGLFGLLLPCASAVFSATPITLTLTPSNYHGFNISCNGGKDGAIDLTIAGGEPPYYVEWSNKENTEDISGLSPGYYKVHVKDDHGNEKDAEITLVEPYSMKAEVYKYEYPNGYNLSCFDCSNGYAEVEVAGGVAPFSYVWEDGPTTGTRSNLGAREYKVSVRDANGCEEQSLHVSPTQPERSDWTMEGNAGTNPETQYIGTSDSKDVVFKSNGQERLRLLGNGDIKLSGSLLGTGPLERGGDGLIRVLDDYLDAPDCKKRFPYWKTSGNFIPICSSELRNPRMGTTNGWSLDLITNDQVRMTLTTTGKVGIGTTSPAADLHVHHAGEARTVTSSTTGTAGSWVKNDAQSFALAVNGAGKGQILKNVGSPVALMTFNKDNEKVGVGTADPEADLHVHHVGTNNLLVSGTSGSAGIWARNEQAGYALQAGGDGKGHILSGWTDPEPVMTFDAGKVGIGTTSPAADLHVHHADGARTVVSTTTGMAAMWAKNSTQSYAFAVNGAGQGQILKREVATIALMTFNENGNVGLGTDEPEASLHVHHAGTNNLLVSGTTGNASLWARNGEGGYALQAGSDGKGRILSGWNDPEPVLVFDQGKVGIGTTPPEGALNGYRLFVEDGIATRDVLVKIGTWPDHVFGDGYPLMPLDDLRAYLQAHHHLPGIPSEKEVELQGGVEIGDTQARMLQVIEEQALYILQLEERMSAMEVRIKGLEGSK